MVLDLLGSPRTMAGLEGRAALVLRTVRIWAGLRMARHCPIEMAEHRLGSVSAAGALRILVETMSAAWPDPVALAPPCCPVLSHDEATIGALLQAAWAGDRRRFDREAEEMLDEDARARLWSAMRALLVSIRA